MLLRPPCYILAITRKKWGEWLPLGGLNPTGFAVYPSWYSKRSRTRADGEQSRVHSTPSLRWNTETQCSGGLFVLLLGSGKSWDELPCWWSNMQVWTPLSLWRHWRVSKYMTLRKSTYRFNLTDRGPRCLVVMLSPLL